jgi:hypothetical protein
VNSGMNLRIGSPSAKAPLSRSSMTPAAVIGLVIGVIFHGWPML